MRSDTLALLRQNPTIPEQVVLLSRLCAEGPSIWGSRPPITRARFPFTAGLLIRRNIRNEIRRHLDRGEVTYDLREYAGWLDSEFNLSIDIKSWKDLTYVLALVRTMWEWLKP